LRARIARLIAGGFSRQAADGEHDAQGPKRTGGNFLRKKSTALVSILK
jgi:hypothetical protein